MPRRPYMSEGKTFLKPLERLKQSIKAAHDFGPVWLAFHGWHGAAGAHGEPPTNCRGGHKGEPLNDEHE